MEDTEGKESEMLHPSNIRATIDSAETQQASEQDLNSATTLEKMSTLNVNSNSSASMFRELATIFQASQMHEGALEINASVAQGDLWSTLRRAERLESEGSQDVSSLRIIKSVLEQLYDRGSKLLQPTLRILADASRDGQWRIPLGQSDIVEYSLAILASTTFSNDVRIQCLRLIGNSCADTDENRERVVSKSQFSALIQSMTVPDIATVAVPALYNICCDYEPAVKEAIQGGLFEILIKILEMDDLKESPAFSYLCRLLDLGLEFLNAIDSPPDSVELLLRCATHPGLDNEDIISLVDTAVAHLQQESFQQHMVDEDLIGVPLRFIIRSYFPRAALSGSNIPPLDTASSLSRDAEEEAEISRVRKSLIQALSDVSALTTFFEKHSSFETPLTTSLMAWITAALPHAQLCACIILGNLAQDDSVCIAIVANTSIQRDLISVLRTSDDAQVLHSSLSFLRNLALPSQNKDILGQCGVFDSLLRFWTSDLMPQVSHAAAAVARQLIIAQVSNIERFMAPLSNDQDSPANAHTHLSAMLALFDRTDEVAVKTEIARTVAAILRSVHSINTKNVLSKNDVLNRLYSHHSTIGKPLGMMVAQNQYPVIRSEGWFAMALMARDIEGAAIISPVVAEAGVYSALEEVVGSTSTEKASNPSDTALEGLENGTPSVTSVSNNDMKAKDRDNALILVNGLLQQQSGDLLTTIRRSALEELLQAGMRT